MFKGLFRRDKRSEPAPQEVETSPEQLFEQSPAPTDEAPASGEALAIQAFPVLESEIFEQPKDILPLDDPFAEVEEFEAPTAAEAMEPEVTAEAPEEPRRRFGFFRRGESEGRPGFFKKVASVFAGRKIDETVLEELEEQLIMSDVSIDTAQHLIETLRIAAKRGDVPNDEAAQAVLKQEISSLLGQEAAPLHFAEHGVTVWLFVGVNGVGKTTTIGKLARRLSGEGHKPLLVAGDTFRAAAMEQLQEWGRRSEVPVVAQQSGADPAAVVYDGIAAAKSRGRDIVLVDTAGRLHTKSNLMNELSKIGRIIERETGAPPAETLLVLDATTGQNGLTQAQAFTQTAPLSGLVLTKWDGTAKGGIILTVARETGVPVKLIGVGEKVEDLMDFDPKAFAEEMFS